jgi:hypothetical protein
MFGPAHQVPPPQSTGAPPKGWTQLMPSPTTVTVMQVFDEAQ